MKELLRQTNREADTLDKLYHGIVGVFERVRAERPGAQIAYVAGIVSSDGMEHFVRNVGVLVAYTEVVRRLRPDLAVFSSTDVFFDVELWKRLARELGPNSFFEFWDDVLAAGVGTVYMTPRSELSRGARRERETAQRLGLEVREVIDKKVWPGYFDAVAHGNKNFELRLGDFRAQPGDILVLREWDPSISEYTGRQVERVVTYVVKFKVQDLKFWPQGEIDQHGLQIISLRPESSDAKEV